RERRRHVAAAFLDGAHAGTAGVQPDGGTRHAEARGHLGTEGHVLDVTGQHFRDEAVTPVIAVVAHAPAEQAAADADEEPVHAGSTQTGRARSRVRASGVTRAPKATASTPARMAERSAAP